MNRPLPTGSDRLPPKAACCKPVHARSPAVSGRLFWRPPPSGMRPAAPPTPPNRLSKSPFLLMQPASAGPPAAPPTPPNRLSKSPFLLMQPACANQLSPLTPAADAPPTSARLFWRPAAQPCAAYPLSLYTRIADYSVTCVTSFFRKRLYACLTAFSFVPTLSATSCHLSPSTWRRSRICRIRLSSTLSM